MTEPTSQARAADLIARSLVWDNHGCMPLRHGDQRTLPELARYRDAGVDVVVLNVGFDLCAIEDNFRVIANFRDWLAGQQDFVRVGTVADIEKARAEGKLAVAFDLEGCCAIDDQVNLIPMYYDLGVRWMLIAYNRNNAVGGGCQDDDPGLTAFGRQVIDEMERVGMVTCCSHTGYRTALDVMEYASNPVILSHSNPRALVDHPRNVPDEVMQACASTGGVIGITGVDIFLGEPGASGARIAEHVDYAVQLIGPAHVGLGFDYCFDQEEVDDLLAAHPDVWPPGMQYGAGIRIAGPEAIEEMVEGLVGRGYADADIASVLGGNFLRVAEQVWK